MSKKFGKLLFLTAAAASAAAAVVYFMRKKEAAHNDTDDDYDDFSDAETEDSQKSRNYVPLNSEDGKPSDESASSESPSEEAETCCEAAPEETQKDSFTPLAEQVAQSTETAEEAVEEFFDEEDSSDEEPPIIEA